MKLKHVLASAVALLCSVATWAQASYNHTYTEGVTVAAGENYFLYNIASGMFLTDGMDYGTHASIDHAGRVITLATSGGGYTVNTTPFSANGSALKNGGLFLNASGEPFVDGTSAEWTFEPVSFSGYTNAYLIKTGEKYLYIDYADNLYLSKMGSFVRSGSNTGDAKSYWLLIPMSARQAVNDYTYLLRNTDMCHPWELPIWNNGNVNMCVGSKENVTAEAWHASFDFSQTISASIPNGKYTLHCQGFYYDTETPTVLYANSDQAGLMRWNQDCNAAQAGAKFLEGAYADNSVTTIVTDHTLKVGVTDPTNKNWQIFDNFYLEYFGSCVVNDAIAFTTGNTTRADKWYYYDIPTTDEYEFTSSNACTLTYTTDGTQLTSEAEGTETAFAADKIKTISLTAGRVYIKTNAATTLSVSYKYNIGAATADKAYVQSGNTVTISFASSTNNPEAVLSQDYSGVTFNSAPIACTRTASGFTFTVPDGLTAGFEYTLSIPAKAIGYAAGSIYNDAQNIIFTTGVVTDGTYYFKEVGADRFLTRGGNYGTEGVTCIHGINFELTMQTEDGSYFVKNVDHSLAAESAKYLNVQYTDQGSMKYFFESAGDGNYYMKKSASDYVKMPIYNALAIPFGYIDSTPNVEEATKWQLMSADEYKTYLAARQTSQIKAIAKSAGLVATSASELEALVSHSGEDRTSSINNAGLSVNLDGWTTKKFSATGGQTPTVKDGAAEVYNGTGGVSQEITGLSAGLYKVTVDACFRMGDAAAADRVGRDANILAYVSASTPSSSNLVRIKNWYDYNGSRPNNRTDFCNVAENYRNTLYVYVSEGETLTLTLGTPGAVGKSWMPFRNWTLTYYPNDPVQANKDYIAAQKGDITGLINSTFDTNAAGWTGGNHTTGLDRSWRSGSVKNSFYERTTAGKMSCTIPNMPAGTYKVVAAWRSISGGEMTPAIAGTDGTTVTGVGDAAADDGHTEINMNGVEMPYSTLGGFTTNANGHNWKWIAATGTLAADGDLVLSFTTAGSAGWNAIDDVHLYCTELKLDGTSYTYTKTLPTIDGNTDLSDYADGSVVTSDIVVRNPNAMMYSGNGYDITTAAGASLNNFMYKKSGFGGAYWAANVVLYDGLKYATPENDKGLYFDNARLYRKFPADTWCTLVLPFWPNDGKFTKKYPSALSGDGVLTFSDATNSTWKTNDKPMLVKSSEDVSVITGGRKGTGFAGTASGNMTSGEGATMYGTYAKIEDISSLGGTNYVLGTDNKLYKVDSKVSLAPFRAYFTVDAGTGVKANIITLNLDGTETAIECIDNVQTTKGNGVIYNLAGQRLSKMQKGVNIVNGKKIFVK